MSDRSERFYVIWSEEHGAWWRPAQMGYTRSLAEAGHYSKSEAEKIVEKANMYLEKKSGLAFNEIAIADPLTVRLIK